MSETESRAVAVAAPPSNAPVSVFYSEASFASAQRMAMALTSSGLVPESYRGKENMGNALIAMDMASRMGLSPMTVMQNLHVIEGRPSWSSNFIISALNSCGLFGPLRWRVTDLGEREVSYDRWEGPKGNRSKVTHKMKVRDKEWVAYAIEKATGEVLEGPPVTLGMAIAEGWYTKPGSKWLTMEDLMGRYRSAAFFGRLYAPHILNGLQTQEEIHDVQYEVVREAPTTAALEDANKPEGRARGLHAAMANKPAEEPKGEESTETKPKPASRKPAAKKAAPEPEPEPETTEEDDAVDAEFTEGGDGEDDAGGDMFGPDDEDDGDFKPA